MYNTIKQKIKSIMPKPLWNLLKIIKRPYLRAFDKKKTKLIIKKVHSHYSEIERKLKNRGDSPIRFACYVMYAADFGESEVFSIMKEDKDFSPKIVVIPDIARGKKHMGKIYHETKDFLLSKFGQEYVLDGYDEKSDTYFDYSDSFDIIALNNPYSEMAHKYHSVEYLSTKNALPFYAVYGFFSTNYSERAIFPRLSFSLLWKVFLDTKYTLDSCKKHSIYHGKNAVAFGYAKMDSLSNYEEEKKTKKRIILSPHHTVNVTALPLSNFLSYYDLILELPDLFPEVDFVFRPHPLLFTNLINYKYWSEQQVADYIDTLQKKGIAYSHGGDYFDLFANSDAIVHDCGSYITEWLFTGKPCCFVAKDNSIFKFFTALGNECIKHYTVAYSRQQIIDFIKNIVEEKFQTNYKDDKTLKQNVFMNYPNTSQKMVDYLRFR